MYVANVFFHALHFIYLPNLCQIDLAVSILNLILLLIDFYGTERESARLQF